MNAYFNMVSTRFESVEEIPQYDHATERSRVVLMF